MTGRARGRVQELSERTVAEVFDRLDGPAGLTATASTFARQDVLAALGGQLAGASRAELEDLTDRFLTGQAVAVVAERALEERRWSTPELLSIEQQLVIAATSRASEQTAVVSHDAVRAALAAHPTAGQDQAAMVRDVCQGGASVALVVGRAGTGKTFALGMARHAWQLDGYRLLTTAPTGIATVSLEAEGFQEVATCDRLLGDLDRKEPREVTLPAWYLDGRQRGERNRRVDLAYATTGHRAQGLTRRRALVRLTGQEDANWLYVQLSRARHETTLYPVVGPEPQGPAELDLPDREPGDGYDQLARALSRAGDQSLAIDTSSSLDLRRLSTRELGAERDRLQRLLDQAPQDRNRELARASARRVEADQALEQLTTRRNGPQRQNRGVLRLRRLRRGRLPDPHRHHPRVMASLRNLAIAILRLDGCRNLAAALRRNARDATRVLPLLGITSP